MNSTGNTPGTGTQGRQTGGEAGRPDLDSREGDPRKRDQQDLRTLGRDDGLQKDDPSRAPESGTP